MREAKKLGFDFVCLTGNPKTGVTNDETILAIKKARKAFGDEGLIIAGKMHGAGFAILFISKFVFLTIESSYQRVF